MQAFGLLDKKSWDALTSKGSFSLTKSEPKGPQNIEFESKKVRFLKESLIKVDSTRILDHASNKRSLQEGGTSH